MFKLNEAVTVRARARAAAKALKELLTDKAVPAELRKQVENLHQAMGKTWADLEADSKMDPEREALAPSLSPDYGRGVQALREAANVGEWFEAMLHLRFTEMADWAFAEGRLTRGERIAMSGAIGQALDAFHLALMQDAVQLYVRAPYGQPEAADAAMMAAEGSNPSGGEALSGEFVALVERSVRGDGTIPVKIIAPGWGSSGYYGAAMLEQAAPKFKAGTKMYWDHPTASEERERPERSLRDLAAQTVSEARWNAQGPAGPGLYAEAKVFDAFRAVVDEIGPHIGVSIRALGKATVGTAEGRTGKVISEISQVGSVDFVTLPGAGGQVLQIFEAARRGEPGREVNSAAAGRGKADEQGARGATQETKKEDGMPEDLKALEEANIALQQQVNQQKADMARLSEMLLAREAGDFAGLELAKVQLPEVTKSKLLKQLAAAAPIKEGRVDMVAFGVQIAEAVKAEQAYLSEAGLGRIQGFGGLPAGERSSGDLEAEIAESFRRIGLNDAAAKQAAKGR